MLTQIMKLCSSEGHNSENAPVSPGMLNLLIKGKVLAFIVGRFRKGFSDHAAFVAFEPSDQSLIMLGRKVWSN